MEDIAEERRDVVVLSPIADKPRRGIENRLETVQETRRRAGQQAVTAVHFGSDECGDGRFRNLER